MVTNSRTIVKSRPPNRYITQSGVDCWAGGGVGGGDGGGGEGEDDDTFGGGEDSVVKALAALQSLRVLEPVALTFQ